MESTIFLVVRLLNFIHCTSYGSIMKCLELCVYVVCMIWISFVLCSFSWYFNLFLASFSSSYFFSFFNKKKNETRERKEKFMKNKIYDKRGERERERMTKGKEYETLCFPLVASFPFHFGSKWLRRILKMAEKFVFSSVSSKTSWQFMFALSSIDIKGICHLNNKSHAALFKRWMGEKIWCRINWEK